jgi:hypothetical protein
VTKNRTYQEEENIKLYLRNILKEYLNYEEKLKEQKLKWPRSTKYIPTSEEILKAEKEYMEYEENVFTELSNLKIEIKSSMCIKVKVSETQIELKDFLKSENILIESYETEESQKEKMSRLENANKIGEVII